MYLRITSRCNMKCGHCCFNATSKGTDMEVATAKAALKLAEGYGMYLTIGGGEPTLHPNFWEILGLALSYSDDDLVPYIVTNGKITDTALRLARMARRGVIGAALSRDEWHDPIEPRVVQAFDYRRPIGSSGDDMRETRSVTRIIKMGRGTKIAGAEEGCACDDLVVDPDGKMWFCAHRTELIGSVFDLTDIPEEYLNCDDRCSNQRSATRKAA